MSKKCVLLMVRFLNTKPSNKISGFWMAFKYWKFFVLFSNVLGFECPVFGSILNIKQLFNNQPTMTSEINNGWAVQATSFYLSGSNFKWTSDKLFYSNPFNKYFLKSCFKVMVNTIPQRSPKFVKIKLFKGILADSFSIVYLVLSA